MRKQSVQEDTYGSVSILQRGRGLGRELSQQVGVRMAARQPRIHEIAHSMAAHFPALLFFFFAFLFRPLNRCHRICVTAVLRYEQRMQRSVRALLNWRASCNYRLPLLHHLLLFPLPLFRSPHDLLEIARLCIQ